MSATVFIKRTPEKDLRSKIFREREGAGVKNSGRQNFVNRYKMRLAATLELDGFVRSKQGLRRNSDCYRLRSIASIFR